MSSRKVFLLVFLAVWIVVAFFSRSLALPVAPNSPQPTFPPPASKFSTSLPISKDIPPPQISAKHVFIMDRGSKMVLYSTSADDSIYPASTTKMMTALVAVEHFSLDTQLTVTRSYPEGVDIGLLPGESVTVENLLYALLVQSANDAAEVLAENYCSSSKLSAPEDLCGRSEFITAMNQWATRLNLSNTHFLNPTGLDQEGHYSSASDLARLADHLMNNAYLSRIVSTENAVITSVDLSQIHPIANVNQLLGKIPGVIGVKTGFTDLAGESLVTLVNRDGHEVILSVMGSTDRFSDATKLIDWIYANFSWD